MGRRREFMAEVPKMMLKDYYGITAHNPQANDTVECAHQMMGNMIRTQEVTCPAGWIRVAKVDTKENLADILTKSLPSSGQNHLMDVPLF